MHEVKENLHLSLEQCVDLQTKILNFRLENSSGEGSVD